MSKRRAGCIIAQYNTCITYNTYTEMHMITDTRTSEELAAAIRAALTLAAQFGGRDTAHHKAWVIDQMCRVLADDGYAVFVTSVCAGEDGLDTYIWDEGIAP
jgi:hypothetical protein